MVEMNNKMTIYERENGSIEVNFGIVGYEPLVLTPQYAIGETFEEKAMTIYMAYQEEK